LRAGALPATPIRYDSDPESAMIEFLRLNATRATAAARSAIAGRGDVVRSGAWSLVLRVLGLVSGFALGVVLARVLGPGDYGVYGLVTTVAALAMTVAQLGTPQLAVRDLSVLSAKGDWPAVRAIVVRFGTVTTLAATLLGITAVVAALLLDSSSDDLRHVGQGALLTVLMSLTALCASELRGLGAMLKGQAMDILVRPALAFAIVLLFLLWKRPLDATNALWIQVAVTLLAALVSVAWVRSAIPATARTGPAPQPPKWLSAALPLGAVDVLRQLDGAYGVILVGWLSSGIELGVFRVAVACMVLASMPLTIMHIVLAPTLSRLNATGDRKELQRVLDWTSAVLVATMIPVTLASWTVGKPLIILVFGAAYADAWLPLALLTTAQLVYALFGMGPILLAMCGGERQLIRIYTLAVGTAILAAVPMTRFWGAPGAGAAPIITAAIIGLLSRRYGRSQLGVEISCLRFVRSVTARN